MSTHHIEIVPTADAGFVCGFPGIPHHADAEHGARIEGEVHITLPFLGVPASAVKIEFQKSESISTDGQNAVASVEKLDEIVLWTGGKSSNMYSRRFPFSIEIPENLPPTVTLDKPGLKVHIQYLLHAIVYRENRIKFWSDKPFTCTVPVTIIKYEHHPAWPIYHHSKPGHTSNGSMSFTVRPMRSCFSPGETIRLVSELSFGSYRVIPRRIDFEARLLQLVTTLESDQQSHHNALLKKQPTVVLLSQHSTSSPRLDHATTFTVELACPIPINVDPTLNYQSRIQVSHILVVTTVIHAEHLQIDIPVIISTFTSHSLTVAQCLPDCESVTDPRLLFRNIGDVPSLGGTPNFENLLVKDLHLQTHSPVSECVQKPITESEEKKDFSVDAMLHTIIGDDWATPTGFQSSPTLSSELDRSSTEYKVRLRKSEAINASDNLEFDADSRVRLNQEISAGWSESEESFMWGLFGESSRSSSVDFLELLGYLTEIIQSRQKTKALLELKGDRAQMVIEFLNSVLIALDLSRIQVRRRIFIILRCLCEASQCYPACDALHNVIVGPREGAGGFCDIYRGRHRDQVLCLKVITRERNNKAMLKSFLQEAILWSQLDHPNILPFYGIYHLGPEKKMCLVSPWLENGNLMNYLHENPTVSRRPFILDVATGLKYLHDKGVIHGDLKSTNVLITSFGRACITDFGLSLARAEASAESLVDETNSETYRWLAPELLVELSSYPSRASDIWAFGCLCYQILTRRVPFYEICSETAVINIVLKGKIPSQTQISYPAPAIDVIDDRMWSLLKLCWNFKPDDRPTCRHITDFLEIKECIEHCSGLAYDQIVGFRIAMREKIDFSFNFKDVLYLFDEINCIGG